MDLGAGDGLAGLRAAKADPSRLFIAVDANADGLREGSAKALRRDGAPNALFVRAAVEALPPELAGLADRVTVTLPWGSLLRAVVLPDLALLAGICGLLQPGGRLDVVYAIDPERDAAALRVLGLDPACSGPQEATCAGYADAGLRVDRVSELAREEIAALGTTWARKLAATPSARRAWRIEATAM